MVQRKVGWMGVVLFLCLWWGQACQSVLAEIWPQFRGPGGMGHTAAEGLPVAWSETSNIAWRTPIRGTGWSSPVVFGDQIWLTTAVSQDASAAELAAARVGQVIPVALAKDLELYAICVDARSGAILHDVLLMEEPSPAAIHTMNSYASPTPVIEAGRVYCHFGSLGTVCVDTASGQILWKNRDLKLDHGTGAGSSPVLWQRLLIFHCDGRDAQYIAALNTDDGSLAWKTARSGRLPDNSEFKKAYCTPVVITADGQAVLVSPAADWVYGYDPQTGRELWKVSYGTQGFSTVPRPVVDDQHIYLCTGYMRSQLLALAYDRSHLAAPPEIRWRYEKQVPAITSPVLVDGTLYFVSDQGGVMTAVEAATGRRLWQQRLGGNYAASPLYAGGHVYLFSREGVCTVWPTAGEPAAEAENQLDGSFMASPAVIGDALILRTDKALYRVENQAG